jgi:hypothetical protein
LIFIRICFVLSYLCAVPHYVIQLIKCPNVSRPNFPLYLPDAALSCDQWDRDRSTHFFARQLTFPKLCTESVREFSHKAAWIWTTRCNGDSTHERQSCLSVLRIKQNVRIFSIKVLAKSSDRCDECFIYNNSFIKVLL